MASVVISGDTSGTATLQAQAIAGNTTLTLPTTSGTVALQSGDLGTPTSLVLTNATGTPSAIVLTNATGTANALNAGIGVNQTWQLPTRAGGTTYTNSTGKPIQVTISFSQNLSGSGSATVVVSGVTISSTSYNTTAGGGGLPYTYSFIVPNGATYSISVSGGTGLGTWAELR